MRELINQSHNLYLDLLIQGGIVALCCSWPMLVS